ncbi:30S ribosomal protein S17 [Candidatus Uhrbacteria bacterium]|nr:30S ribosomal protein S17 [Candidatus Uhrbacteria bacterium]
MPSIKKNDAKAKKSTVGRTFTGVVVSDAMDKTIVVSVSRTRVHPKYKKRYTVSKKYHVHDEKNEKRVGDTVSFVETRPLSRHKRWRLI